MGGISSQSKSGYVSIGLITVCGGDDVLVSVRSKTYHFRNNRASQGRFDVENVPHSDTLNYAVKGLDPNEVQEVVCSLVDRLIPKKVLNNWRLFDNYLIAVDGTGILTFQEWHQKIRESEWV